MSDGMPRRAGRVMENETDRQRSRLLVLMRLRAEKEEQ